MDRRIIALQLKSLINTWDSIGHRQSIASSFQSSIKTLYSHWACSDYLVRITIVFYFDFLLV
jgi:hypothetical protein